MSHRPAPDTSGRTAIEPPTNDSPGSRSPRFSARLVRALMIVFLLPWIVICITASRDGLLVYVGGVLLLGGLAWLAARRKSESKLVQLLEVVGWNVVFLFLLLEAGTRLYLALGHPPSWLIAAPDQLAYRLNPAEEWLGSRPNSAGFYDEEFSVAAPPGVTRIVALGDSFTVGMVPFAENYLTLVEAALGEKVQIYNLGVVHMAPRQYLEILQSDGLALKPDVVLIGLYLGNDIRPDPPRGLLSGWGSAAATSARRTWTVVSQEQQGSSAASHELFATAADGTRTELPMMDVEHYLEHEYKHLDRLMRPPERRRELTAWRDTERALEELVQLGRERGIPMLVTIAPDEIQVSPTLLSRVTERFALNPSDYDLEYPTRRMLAKFRELDVPVLDLGPVLRQAETQAPTYHLRGVHWNRFGNEVVAQVLEPWLRDQLAALRPQTAEAAGPR